MRTRFSATVQAEKGVICAFHNAILKTPVDKLAEVMNSYTSPNWIWQGVHPFNKQVGARAVVDSFWSPLLSSFTGLQRRADIFMASRNRMDGFSSKWVLSMGHLMGNFDRPWLGIRPTGRLAMLRYAEFNRVENGLIAETVMFCDIAQFMVLSSQNPFPPQTGAHVFHLGPKTQDGVMWDAQSPSQAQSTWDAIERMLHGEGRQFHHPHERELLQQVWHEDMVWWGPAGIGSTFSIPGYMKHHTNPFDDAFAMHGGIDKPDSCQLAEGNYGALFGLNNMSVRSDGGFLGMTGSARNVDIAVADIYRVEDGKIAENWVFMDLLAYLNRLGLDILKLHSANVH